MKHSPVKVDWDAYYLSRPDPRPKMLWPVYQDTITMRPVKWFEDYGDAASFVSANLGKANLYIGEPKRRKA
jgi:hypothetical protein